MMRKLSWLSLLLGSIAAQSVTPVAAQAPAPWRPEKAVEVILPTAAGGTNDQMARLVQKVLGEKKLVTTPIVVMNKPGGNQTLAAVYLRQHPNDPHYLLYSASSVITGQITGLIKEHYSDLTPISLMMVERTAITVATDSPIKSMRDLVTQLTVNPEALSIGMATRGGANHQGLSQVLKAAGVEPRKLKTVVFKTNVESMTALVGGHLQVVASSATAALPWVQRGQARYLAIFSPQRLPGPFAHAPTLREQGYNVTPVTNWRGMFGARGLTAAEAAFWEEAMAQVYNSPDWQKMLEQGHLTPVFMRRQEFSKFLEAEHQSSQAVLRELGFAK